MNHRSLNNLTMLLSTNRDYFFTAPPLRCEYSDRSIIAFGLDKAAAQYFIYPDMPIPQMVELAEQVAFMGQEAARADFQDLKRIAPILWVAPKAGTSLREIAALDSQFKASWQTVEQERFPAHQHAVSRWKSEGGFWPGGRLTQLETQPLSPPDREELEIRAGDRLVEEQFREAEIQVWLVNQKLKMRCHGEERWVKWTTQVENLGWEISQIIVQSREGRIGNIDISTLAQGGHQKVLMDSLPPPISVECDGDIMRWVKHPTEVWNASSSSSISGQYQLC
jgi:hypothetical protein